MLIILVNVLYFQHGFQFPDADLLVPDYFFHAVNFTLAKCCPTVVLWCFDFYSHGANIVN
jgi:hypothetical protein